MATTTHYYLPYYRTGLGALNQSVDPSQPRIQQRVKLGIQARLARRGGWTPIEQDEENTRTAERTIGLYGAGDVLGFRESIINRLQPRADIGNFGPELIPFIEFKEPDFPWRYSSVKHNNNEGKYWLPWLSLVVLKNKDGSEEGEFTPDPQPDPELPKRIRVTADAELPDLKESWRWAHLHTTDKPNLTRSFLQEKIQQRPHQFRARILCPRRLKAGTKYTAFVVPTYKRGWEAAMGEKPTMALGDLTWETPKDGQNSVLPYYYSWEFRTGRRGDFEYLLKQLRFQSFGQEISQKVDCSNPGYGLAGVLNGEIAFPGALAANPKDSTDSAAEPEAPPTTNATDLGPFKKKVSDLLNVPIRTKDKEKSPWVLPPVYGRWYFGDAEETPELREDDSVWLLEVNLDPRYRFAAGLGAQYVKEKQEELMQSAWQQLREFKKANRAINVAKFGRAVSEVMHRRLNKVSPAKLFLLASPLQKKVPITAEITERKSAFSDGTNWRQYMQQNAQRWQLLRSPKLRKFMDSKPVKMGTITARPGQIEVVNQQIKVVNQRNAFIIDRVEQITWLDESKERKTWLDELKESILDTTDPKKNVQKKYADRIEHLREVEAAARDVAPATKDALRPLTYTPQFHTPTYRYLRDHAQNFLLPGVENIPQNTVTLLKTDPKFIEAFMLGANHEMAAELRWREFPATLRGSYFRKFWDATIYSLDAREQRIFAGTYQGTGRERDDIEQQMAEATVFRNKLLAELTQIGFTPANPLQEIDRLRTQAASIEDPVALEAIQRYEAAVEEWLLTREADKDIEPIERWLATSTLGDHIKITRKDQGDQDDQPVLLIRGDILNKCPNLLIYLVKKKKDEAGKFVPNYQKQGREFPIFEANLPPDIVMLGFGINVERSNRYFLVFEEPLQELQYGLDERELDENGNFTTNNPDADDPMDLANLSWQHFNADGDQWEGFLDGLQPKDNEAKKRWNNPSYIAKAFTQKSVRIAIPLERFIQPKND